MDSARQIIRWSIPGALLLIGTAGAYIALRLGAGDGLKDATHPIANNISPATGIALSIPLGFLIYQLYYVTYTPRRVFGIVSSSRGLAMLQCLTPAQLRRVAQALPTLLATPANSLDASETGQIAALTWQTDWATEPGGGPHTTTGAQILADVWSSPPVVSRRTGLRRVVGGCALLAPEPGWPSRADRRAVAKLYHERWVTHHAVGAILLDLTSFARNPGDVKADAVPTSDVYHAQGAARAGLAFGVLAGFVAAVVGVLVRDDREISSVIGPVIAALAVLGTLAFAVWILSRVRHKAFRLTARRLGHGLRVLLADEPELIDLLAGESRPEAVGNGAPSPPWAPGRRRRIAPVKR